MLCKDCKWWEFNISTEAIGKIGFCHRFSPMGENDQSGKAEEYEEDKAVWFPQTWEEGWCGEFKERVPKEPEVLPAQLTGRDCLYLSTTELDIGSHVYVRALKCLSSVGIKTIGDLIKHNSRELLRIRNFGDTCLRGVKAALVKRGLGFLGTEKLSFPEDDENRKKADDAVREALGIS